MAKLNEGRLAAFQALAEGKPVEISIQVSSGFDAATLVASMKLSIGELLGREVLATQIETRSTDESVRYRFTLQEPTVSNETPPADTLMLA